MTCSLNCNIHFIIKYNFQLLLSINRWILLQPIDLSALSMQLECQSSGHQPVINAAQLGRRQYT